MTSQKSSRGVVRTLIDNSALLITGAVAALVWANIDPDSYHHVVHYDITSLWSEHASVGDLGSEHRLGI